MLIKRFNPYSQIEPEPKIPPAHRKFYFGLLFFFVIGIFAFFLGTEKQIVNCVYNNKKEVYNCEVNSKTLFIDRGTSYFNNITNSVLVTRRGTCHCSSIRYSKICYPGNLYNLHFVNRKGTSLFVKNLGCKSDSIFHREDKAYKAATEEINKINTFFAGNKDFVYELSNQIIGSVIFSWVLIFVPLFIFFVMMRSAKARRILNEFCLNVKKDN